MSVRKSLLWAVALDVLIGIAVLTWLHVSAAQRAAEQQLRAEVARLGAAATQLADRATQQSLRATRAAIRATRPRIAQLAHTGRLSALDGPACPPASATLPLPGRPLAPLSERCVRSLAEHPRRMFRDIERRTFDYFWLTADPKTGLSPDRWPARSPASIAAVGFALTADVIGAYRGYVTRHEAAARVRKVLSFLLSLPQGRGPRGYAGYHGFFYHFINMHTGLRYGRSELSTIDTALLMAGVLTAGEYFDHDTPTERRVRQLANQLYRRVDWSWAAPGGSSLVSMAWHPRHGFSKLRWHGYNEASILYILGLGSPTHPLAQNAWSAWSATDHHDLRHFGGLTLLSFGPQFGYQYTAVWVDLRGIADPFMRAQGETYFLNGVIATLVQRRYAIINPHGWGGYGPNIWGLTACDGPGYVRAPYHGRMRQFYGYVARGISKHSVDDGTLAPTAAIGSLMFVPRYVTEATQALLRRYGDMIYTRFGFVDSFNPSFTNARLAQDGRVVPGRGWVDTAFLGIDQGPIIAMIENERSRLIWRIMRHSPYIRRGLQRAGFTGGWLDKKMAHAAARHRRHGLAARVLRDSARTRGWRLERRAAH
ncbi:MAG: glucoamylase family protein [Steroidobacteraceae bacterium]